MALAGNPTISAARHMEEAADARIRQTDTAMRPKVEWRENVQGGNNPVYVFSSLLTQRQFSAENFAIRSLVRPDTLQNFQSQLIVDQPILDFGRSRARRKEASAARALTAEEKRRRELEVLTQTARAYFGSKLAESAKAAAESSVRSTEATLEQAKNLRAAGRATDADVLAVEVDLAGARENLLARGQDQEVALATLNTAMGQPMETVHELTTGLQRLLPEPLAAAVVRPEVKAAGLQETVAAARLEQADAMRRPEVGLRFIAEADRQRFVTRGGTNWFAAATMRWSLFDGGLARELRSEALSSAATAREEVKAVSGLVALQVKRSDSALRTAEARIQLTATVTEQAKETLRILKNRYGAGLAALAEVLRAEAALFTAESRRLAAMHDYRIAHVERAAAAGTLHGDSNELR